MGRPYVNVSCMGIDSLTDYIIVCNEHEFAYGLAVVKVFADLLYISSLFITCFC